MHLLWYIFKLLVLCCTVADAKIPTDSAVHGGSNKWPGLLGRPDLSSKNGNIRTATPRINPDVSRCARSTARRLVEFVVTSEAIAAVPQQFPKSVGPVNVVFIANLIVYSLWKVSKEPGERALFQWMNRHFVHTHVDGEERKIRQETGKQLPSHTVLTSAFSHQDFAHLTSNMGALATFGPKVSGTLGTRAFSYFYIGAIYASHFFEEFVYRPNFAPQQRKVLFFFLPKVGSLGASGAISAVITYYCLKFPLDWLKLSDLFSDSENEEPEDDMISGMRIRAWVFGLFAFACDAFRLGEANIGYGAHIGGSIFGASVYIINCIYGVQIGKAAATIDAKLETWMRPLRNLSANVTRPIRRRWAKLRPRLTSTFKSMCQTLSDWTTLFLDTFVVVLSEMVEFD